MKKSNRLPILVTCMLLILAMAGAVYAESLPADEFVCICEHEHNSETCNAKCPVCNPTYTGTYKSPCACCLPPVVMFEAEAPVTYDGTEHKLGAFKIKFSQEPPVVTCDNARVEYAGIDAATEMEVWNVYATNAGTYTIKANVVGLKENNLDPRTFTEVVEIAKAPVTIAFNKEAINYFYHENALQQEKPTYLSVAEHTTIEGVVEGEEIAYELVADLENDEAGFVKVNPEGYAWRIVCKTEDYSNYAITVGAPAKVIVNYWEGVQLDFTNEPNAAGWYNAANKAEIKLADSGMTIAKQLNGTYGAVVTDYADADADDNAYGTYFLENANGARSAAMKTVSTYKQDTVAPEAILAANGGGWYKVSTKDIPNNEVMSDVNVVELLSGSGDNMKVFRTILAANGAGDTYTVVDGYMTFNGVFKFVAKLQVRVEDEAGNVTTSNIINDYNSDKDGDGLNNAFEGVSYDSEDYDKDGLTDYFEETSGYSDRLLFDTDGDGLSDGIEHSAGLNARREDTDNDGVKDPDYLRYLAALGLEKPDIELGMLLMQSNLTHANNQEIVPAADLVMLKDSTFQMDNGQDAGASYSILENRTGMFGQLNRYNKYFYMIRFDERDGRAVYLTASNNGTVYLVMANMTNRGVLDIEVAYETPYTTETGNLAVSTSADGTIVVLAPWNEAATTENVLLVNMTTGEQFRFGGVADTVGATRFALSNDGAVLAYVGADKLLHTINMTKEDYADVEYAGNALHFMADGQLLTNVDETTPNGVYHVEQPTIERVSLLLVDDGELTALEINGHFYYRNYALYCQVDELKRASDGIRIHNLYNKVASKK